MSENRPGAVDVAVIPHPFSAERIRHRYPCGASVAEIVAQAQPDEMLARHAHVWLSGDYIPRQSWSAVRPKPGTSLSIRMVPAGGGGGKNPLRTVLALAVMAGAPYLAAGAGGIFGGATVMGVSLGGLVSKGAGLLGRLALAALAPPPRPRFGRGPKESPTLFIQGARNQAYPFGRVPKVLGRHRFIPPFGALPYTETLGNEQYLRLLFVWGYGPLEISDLKIGETPLSEFEGVEVETRQGYPDDPPITLYTNSVIQNDLQVPLTAAAGFVTRTTEADAEEISVDLTLPRGLFRFGSRGGKKAASVKVEVQYSPHGLEQWSAGAAGYTAVGAQSVSGISRPEPYVYNGASHEVTRIDRIVLDPASGAARLVRGVPFRAGIDSGAPQPPDPPAGTLAIARVERRSGDADVIPAGRITDERDLSLAGKSFQASGDFLAGAAAVADTVTLAAGGLQFCAFDITGKQSAAIRKSVSFRVPKGQYDVRVRRLTADPADDSVFDETVWTALRTVRYVRPVAMEGVALTALRIKATDQLNGVIDRFNGVVHSILPDWNGSAWVEQVTSNPASLFRHVLQGSANARPLADSRIDLAKLQSWHETCAADGHEFNAVIDYDVSVREALQDIAAAGRASPSLVDGKWGVVEDKPQAVPVQHFTPRNTFGFRGEKSFDEIPEALRVRFINRNKGWLQDERLVFDDGYDAETATKYEVLELPGVTSPDQAWRCGRYHIAAARLRPESYIFFADVEHIVCTRGDLIRFTHDVPLFGLMSGRVKSLTVEGGSVTAVTLDAGMPMWEGKSYAVRFRRSDGSSLVASVVTAPGTQTTLTFAVPIPAESGPAAGDLAMFGESGQESVELVVRSIEPQANLTARITCVAASPAVHTASAAPLPAFASVLTAAPERPPAPVLAQMQSGPESMIRHTDGSLSSRIVATFAPPAFGRPLSVRAQIRAQGETDFRDAEVLSLGGNRVSVTDVEEGEAYDLRFRYATAEGALSAPLTVSGHRVKGTSALPSDVANFSLNILGSTAYLSWDAVTDIDLSHYVLRFSTQTAGADWSSATDLVAQIARDATSVSVPAASGTYLIKAADVGGRLSANAAAAVSTIPSLAGFNAVLTLAEAPGFAGGKSGVCVSGGALRLTGADSIDDWADIDAVSNTDIGESWLLSAGTYTFAQSADLGAVYTSRLTADLAVSGLDLNSLTDIWPDVDAVESWDQTADPSLWSAALQLRTTGDDPGGTPTWSAWTPFTVGDYAARAFQFRCLLGSGAPTVTPAVTGLSVSIDMPDRTAAARNIVSDASGSAVTFAKAFKETPAISITAQNMAAGDYYAITSPSASGFSIRFFDSGGAGVSRTFDYLAKGYGEQA